MGAVSTEAEGAKGHCEDTVGRGGGKKGQGRQLKEGGLDTLGGSGAGRRGEESGSDPQNS